MYYMSYISAESTSDTYLRETLTSERLSRQIQDTDVRLCVDNLSVAHDPSCVVGEPRYVPGGVESLGVQGLDFHQSSSKHVDISPAA